MSFQYRFAPHMTKIHSDPILKLLPKLNERSLISFAPGAPAAETFPYQDIIDISNEILIKKPVEVMQYGISEGYPPARRAMASMIARYGLSPRDNEIVITTGGQQAIDLLCKLFIEPGDVALVEAPTYSAALQIVKGYRGQPIHVNSDGDGIIPEDLEKKINIFKPKIVYLNPTFKNPSGATMSLERRKAAAEITGRLGVLLIEDDPYRDLRYKGVHLPPIKSFDRTGNVVFITSASNIISPAMRVGAAYMPEDLAAVAAKAKHAADMHSPALPQAIVGEFIERGLLEPHVAKICGANMERLDLAMRAISDFFPAKVEVSEPAGGLYIWCVCAPGVNAAEITERALKEKVAIIAGEQYFCNGNGRNTFRLSFTGAAKADMARGVEILGRILQKYA
jgi:2-aminoadipate transaminase